MIGNKVKLKDRFFDYGIQNIDAFAHPMTGMISTSDIEKILVMSLFKDDFEVYIVGMGTKCYLAGLYLEGKFFDHMFVGYDDVEKILGKITNKEFEKRKKDVDEDRKKFLNNLILR